MIKKVFLLTFIFLLLMTNTFALFNSAPSIYIINISQGGNSSSSSGGSGNITGYGTAGNIALWSNASNVYSSVLFQYASKIGIGTATPVAALHVRNETWPQIEVDNLGGTGHAGVQIYQYATGVSGGEEAVVDFNALDAGGNGRQLGSLSYIWADATAGTGRSQARIHANKLGGGSNSDFRLTGDGGIELFGTSDVSWPGANVLKINGFLNLTGATTSTGLYTATLGTPVHRLISTDATTQSQFQADSATGRSIVMGSFGDSRAGTTFGQNNAAASYVTTATGGANYPDKLLIGTIGRTAPIYFGTNNVLAMVIDGTQKVGINVSSPNTALHVNGTVTATEYIGDGSKLTGISAGSFSSYSDSQVRTFKDKSEFTVSTAVYNTPWIGAAVASGTIASGLSTQNNPGVLNMSAANAGASSGYQFSLGNVAGLRLAPNYYTDIVFFPQCQATVVNRTEIKLGFLDAFTSGVPVDGVYFNISGNTTTTVNVTAVASNNSVRVSSPVFNMPCNAWYRASIYINGTNSARMVIVNSTQGVVINTNLSYLIPTTVGRETGHGIVGYVNGIRYTAQGLGLYQLDYMEVGYNGSINR